MQKSQNNLVNNSKQIEALVIQYFISYNTISKVLMYSIRFPGLPEPSSLALLMSFKFWSVQYTKPSTGSNSMTTACCILEIGKTTAVWSGVSKDTNLNSVLFAINKKFCGPVTKFTLSVRQKVVLAILRYTMPGSKNL